MSINSIKFKDADAQVSSVECERTAPCSLDYEADAEAVEAAPDVPSSLDCEEDDAQIGLGRRPLGAAPKDLRCVDDEIAAADAVENAANALVEGAASSVLSLKAVDAVLSPSATAEEADDEDEFADMKKRNDKDDGDADDDDDEDDDGEKSRQYFFQWGSCARRVNKR